ncbi:GIY-YIG nuclease family protein [Marinoscillum sp.]|uniref:GIY-YIG nuclease family protein n=1 Tax=Marinoscillum sp. TaxID=2024838 RepID=UPI003BAA8159
MASKGGYVYIVTNPTKTTLYVGVTSNLYARIYDHKEGFGSYFTTKYKCKHLVYYEFFDRIEDAIQREKRLKKWNRQWKDDLITKFNPSWKDLHSDVEEMQ